MHFRIFVSSHEHPFQFFIITVVTVYGDIREDIQKLHFHTLHLGRIDSFGYFMRFHDCELYIDPKPIVNFRVNQN